MENPGEICGIARNEPQRALLIESLETIEQLPGNFQVRLHSETHEYEFIHFFRGANGKRCRSDAGERKIRFSRRSAWRVRTRLSLPHRQTVDRAFLEILIVRDCANHLCKFATRLDEVELASLTRFVRGERAGDARRVARWMQARDGGSWADQSRPKLGLLVAPALCEIRAFKLFSINREDRIGFLW